MYRVTFKSLLSRTAVFLAALTLMGLINVAWAKGFASTPGAALTDFDGDSKSDMAFFGPSVKDPSLGEWMIQKSSDDSVSSMLYGTSADLPVLGDYDGDRLTDLAVVHNDKGQLVWQIISSSTATNVETSWGRNGDVPVPGDYDGDGKTDIAVFRPEEGMWYILETTGPQIATQFGLGTDRPVPGDYDGDGRTDIAVFRPEAGAFYSLNSKGGDLNVQTWKPHTRNRGTETLVPADYDGDGRTDPASFNARAGLWFILESTTGDYRVEAFGGDPFCGISDIDGSSICQAPGFALPGDFDGDGKIDTAVWKPAAGKVDVLGSLQGDFKILTAARAGMISVSSSFINK